jgi:hypothetical protein
MFTIHNTTGDHPWGYYNFPVDILVRQLFYGVSSGSSSCGKMFCSSYLLEVTGFLNFISIEIPLAFLWFLFGPCDRFLPLLASKSTQRQSYVAGFVSFFFEVGFWLELCF